MIDDARPGNLGLSRRALAAGVVATVAGALGGCDFFIPHDAGPHRFRLTVTAETPAGPRSASGVLEATYGKIRDFNGGGLSYQASMRGEAVFLDLGQGRHVIMLMENGPGGSSFPYLPTTVLLGLPGTFGIDALLKGQKLQGAKDLATKDIPMLVTFGDLNDPASARVVPPTDQGFAEAFGPGHRLSSVRLEMVSAGIWPLSALGWQGVPITRGIEKRLPWWDQPRPWLKQIGRGVYIDTRPTNQIRLANEHFMRGF
jgi:hypothetical protein